MKKPPSSVAGSFDVYLEAGTRNMAQTRTERATLLLMATLALYCVVGLTGFDPSKQDEAHIFGIALEYLRGGPWIVPTLAGEPFMEKPPLFYLMAWGCARALASWLPLHDGARLASGLCTALTGLFLAHTARLLWGNGYGRYAVITLFGTFGFLVPSHLLLTDNANLSGIALALLGLAYANRGSKLAGLALGTGSGVAFLSKGLFGVGVIALSIVLLLVLFREWRTRFFLRVLVIAGAFSLPWLLVWPFLLYQHSPKLFVDWLWLNNLGRFFGFAAPRIAIVHQGDFWYRVLPWATLPALPLALLTLTGARKLSVDRAEVLTWRHPAVMISLAFILSLTVVLSSSASIRGIYAMPLLLPLALLAAPALRSPPRWLEMTLLAGGILLFVVLAIGSFVLWIVLALGFQPPFPDLFEHWLVSGLKMPVRAMDGFAALGFFLLWIICLHSWRHTPWRGAGVWYVSVLVVIGIIAQLWIPWVSESRRSYRALYEQMAPFLPGERCIASEGLGESQRVMLDYVLGLKTRRAESGEHHACAALLVDGSAGAAPERAGWQLLWSGKRAADDHEQFWLFVPASELDVPAVNVGVRR